MRITTNRSQSMKYQNPIQTPPNEGAKAWSSEPPAPYRRTEENELDRLKNRLLRQELARATGANAVVTLRRAANEAASLAWLEPFPMLVFPELFAEKLTRAWTSLERQRDIRTRSAHLLLEAA